MRNIKKALLGAVLTLILIVGVQAVVRCCYEDWDLVVRNSKTSRKELEGTLDTLYCGTSLTYHMFMPNLLDKIMGTNSFNLGTGGQPYIGSYYLIRETAEKNPIEQIYLVVSLASLIKGETADAAYLSGYEYLNSWKWKLAYLLDVKKEDVWTAALLYSTQVEEYFDLRQVKENLLYKYVDVTYSASYDKRGYRGTKKEYMGRAATRNTDRNYWEKKLGEEQIQEEAYEYLEKIVEFCREKGIHLTLVIPPFTQDYLDGAGAIEEFQKYIAQKAENWNVELFDFMRYKERETLFTNDKFKDSFHMNNAGAKAFGYLLAEIEQSDDPQGYFNEIDESED